MENIKSIKKIDDSIIEDVLATQFDMDEDIEYTRMRRLSKEFANKVGGVRDDFFCEVHEVISAATEGEESQ